MRAMNLSVIHSVRCRTEVQIHEGVDWAVVKQTRSEFFFQGISVVSIRRLIADHVGGPRRRNNAEVTTWNWKGVRR